MKGGGDGLPTATLVTSLESRSLAFSAASITSHAWTTSLNDSRRGRQRSISAFMLWSRSPITIFLLSMYFCKEHWHSGHLKLHSFALAWHWEMYAHTLSLGAYAREKNSAHAPTIQCGPITTLLTMSIASAVESCLNSCLPRRESMRCCTSVTEEAYIGCSHRRRPAADAAVVLDAGSPCLKRCRRHSHGCSPCQVEEVVGATAGSSARATAR